MFECKCEGQFMALALKVWAFSHWRPQATIKQEDSEGLTACNE